MYLAKTNQAVDTAWLKTNLDPGLNQKRGKIDYFLIQLLSEHGDFQIGQPQHHDYVFCNGVVDDINHTFFSYGR